MRRDTPVAGAGGIPWSRGNDHPNTEIHNIYSDNEHGDDRCGGADASFEENWPPPECR